MQVVVVAAVVVICIEVVLVVATFDVVLARLAELVPVGAPTDDEETAPVIADVDEVVIYTAVVVEATLEPLPVVVEPETKAAEVVLEVEVAGDTVPPKLTTTQSVTILPFNGFTDK